MIDSDLVRRKLARLNMYLGKLKPIADSTYKEYISDFYKKTSAERMIQLIVECASDINTHVILESGERPPENYSSSFIKAAEVKLINNELANKLKGSGGMRNIIVHEYMEIDDKKIYEIIPTAISDYKEYMRQVYDFLDRLEKED
ncbi:MAG: type VII toxin-antitoxin system HepT family RNase toxin [Acidobacteriota bacterium]